MMESHTGLPHLALSASVYAHLSLPDALPRMASLGCEAIELVADQPHFFPAHWTMGQAMCLARSLEAEGLRVVNLSCETGRGFFSPIPAGPIYEPSMITPQLAGRRLRMQHLRRCLDLAFTLGAPCISVASGVCLPGVPPAMAWEHLNEALTVLLSHAEELGVLVAIAPRPGHLIGHTEDALALLEALPHPLLGVSLDTAQLTAQGEPLQAAFMALSDRTWTVQLTDAKLPSPYRLRPGLGDVDWLAVSDVLRAIGYQGPCTLHLENYLDAPDMAAQQALVDAERMLRGLMPVA